MRGPPLWVYGITLGLREGHFGTDVAVLVTCLTNGHFGIDDSGFNNPLTEGHFVIGVSEIGPYVFGPLCPGLV
jgi:hypothetical protein